MAIAKPTILFEDDAIIVCVKPSGIASQSAKSFQPDMTDILRQHIVTSTGKKGEPYIGVIHRLDQPVGGVMVYAKTPAAAAKRTIYNIGLSDLEEPYPITIVHLRDLFSIRIPSPVLFIWITTFFKSISEASGFKINALNDR